MYCSQQETALQAMFMKADYTEKMAGNMIMPNGLFAYKQEMSGAELKEMVRAFVEGYEGGLVPFNRGSLPVASGISMEIKENKDGYTLTDLKMDGKSVKDKDTFTVTCLATAKHMEAFPEAQNLAFTKEDAPVKDTWINYVSNGDAVLAEPEDYITLR